MRRYAAAGTVPRTPRPSGIVFTLALSLLASAGPVYGQPEQVAPTRTGTVAEAQTGDDVLWKRLDITKDGWLDGKELDGGWKRFDSNKDNEVTKSEFMAGRMRERSSSTVGSADADILQFQQLDISKNGSLSGTELEAGNVRRYDADGDGRVTRKEFLDAREKLREDAANGTAAAPTPVSAPLQESSRYKSGDRIWYKKSRYPLVWEEGVFLKLSPDGTQPVIRQKPNAFFKDGFETGAQWLEIRPISEPPLTQAELDANTAVAAAKNGTGLMSQTEILQFLESRIGPSPFTNPQLDQIKKELILMIKRRGLDFRDETGGEFYTKSRRYGLSTEVTFPLHYNYGAPTRQDWLMGTWSLSKISAAVDYVENNKVYRQNEFGVGNVGSLTLKADGAYDWKSGTAQSIAGKWRKATFEEMKYQGGDGVVLLKAKGGWDWIVMQDRVTQLKEEWIYINELTTRQVRESGTRKTGGK